MIRRSVSRIRHPIKTSMQVIGSIAPETLWHRYERLAQMQGITQPCFVLSMDCDTDKDIEVAGDVHERLGDIGIKPVYAVPGELLEEGRTTYRAIAKTGAEFMNHGYRRHTTYDPDTQTYESFFFYDQLTAERVRRDIQEGHEAVVDVIGDTPSGFRTPHFGSFQKPAELQRLHGILADLGYRYSSSTMPFYGLRWGPVLRRQVYELPVIGSSESPLKILDSWSFRFDSSSGSTMEDYERQVMLLADKLDAGRPLFVNLYADPSQVYDWPGFFHVMRRLSNYALPSYNALLDRLLA